MNTTFEEVLTALDAGSDLVVATIVGHGGSTPRTSGSKMIIFGDGSISGTIGGGAVEGEVIGLAPRLFRNQGALIAQYDLNESDRTVDMDLICGGRLQVLLEYVPVSEATRELYRKGVSLLRNGRSFLWKAQLTEDGEHYRVERELAAKGETPPPERAGPLLVDTASGKQLVEPVEPADPVYLVGGGHVSRALASLTRQVGFRTLVFDDREAFANRRRFPDADQVKLSPGYRNLFDSFAIGPNSSIVIVTRGHRFDREVLSQALRTEAGYIGMIGSRRKRDSIYSRLIEEGFSPAALEQVHCPIGLAIEAETPEEIGVSVVAELIQHRARRRRHG